MSKNGPQTDLWIVYVAKLAFLAYIAAVYLLVEQLDVQALQGLRRVEEPWQTGVWLLGLLILDLVVGFRHKDEPRVLGRLLVLFIALLVARLLIGAVLSIN
ncbi:hypothetical protein KQI84_00140 [bacterium]|nr:hypothetical protein [bacterium]